MSMNVNLGFLFIFKEGDEHKKNVWSKGFQIHKMKETDYMELLNQIVKYIAKMVNMIEKKSHYTFKNQQL